MAASCTDCGQVLTEAEVARSYSCPKCGSRNRTISVTGALAITLSGVVATATAVVTDPPPSILLQAVVLNLGSKSLEGQLIQGVVPPWLQIIELVKRDPAYLYQIPDRKMEEMIAGWYKEAGFDEVTLTPRSGDYGRDVIAVKRGLFQVRIIDQVKAYKPGHLVPANDVRAMAGVLSTDLKATKGLVTTTSDFAPMIKSDPYIAPLVPYRLELINGSDLVKRLEGVTKGLPL